jgi:hypothetical protein
MEKVPGAVTATFTSLTGSPRSGVRAVFSSSISPAAAWPWGLRFHTAVKARTPDGPWMARARPVSRAIDAMVPASSGRAVSSNRPASITAASSA